MTDARSTYDESNEVWPYFLLTIIGVALIPLTLGQLAQLLKAPVKAKDASAAHKEYRAKVVRKRQVSSTSFWLVVVGWVAVASLIYVIRSAGDSTVVDAPAIWDPYEILNVAHSASVKQIKSAYRKLSLEFHPDKVKDLAEVTKEEIEAKYVEIAKAYRALTDEVTRENYIQYGHPDGPQPVVHGIALPAFLFNPAASFSFVMLYLLGFGIGVPVVVGKWWTKSQRRTRKGILQETATQFTELFAKEQAHFINSGRLLKCVLLSADMDDALASHDSTLSSLSYEERMKIVKSYLNRSSPQTQLELLVASEVSRLLCAMHDFAVIFRSYALCSRIWELNRAIVQCVPLDMLKQAGHLQLKGADLEKFKAGKMDAAEIAKVVDGARSYFPKLQLLSAEFRVQGESKVTVQSQVHLEMKFLVVPLGDRAPKLNAKEIAADAEDVGTSIPVAKFNQTLPELPEAVTPYFPDDARTTWYAYIWNERDGKLLESTEISRFDLHNLKLSREQVENGDDVVIGKIVVPIKAPTPPIPQKVPFRFSLISSVYFDNDVVTQVVMDVVPASEPTRSKDDLDNEIAEEDNSNDDDDESEDEVEGLSDLDTSSEEEDNIEEGDK